MRVDKSTWRKLSFQQIGKSQLGKTLDSKKNTGKPYPYLCAVNVGYGDFNLSNIKEILLEDNELDKYLVKQGDLLICEGGDTGRCAIWKSNEPIYYQNALHRVRFNNNINSHFIMYALHYFKQNGIIDRLSHGQTIKHFTQKGLNRLMFNIPELSIQERIAAELDAIQSMIDGYKAQIADLDTLAQSIFLDMFGDPVSNPKGWEIKTIGNIGILERGAGISKKDFVEKGLPCIHYGQIHTSFGACAKTHLSCIPEDLLPKYKIAHPGDIIMAITSEDVEGSCKSTVWQGNYDVVVGSDAAILHHNQNGVYVSYYTKTRAFYYEKAKYAAGFKVTHISTKEIERIHISVPPLILQQQFATQIEAIEKQKELIRLQLKDAETLMAERMQYYFS